MSTLLARDKEKILEYMLANPAKKVGVRELAKTLHLSPAHVSRTLSDFRADRLVDKGTINLANPLVRSLKIFFNIRAIQDKNIVKKLTAVKTNGVGIYGSWASGTNYEDSDLDIWIKVNKHPGEVKVASISGELRKALERQVQILVLTPERIKRMKDTDPLFYYSLVYGSMILWGEAIE